MVRRDPTEWSSTRSSPLARIATVGDDDQPDVVPVGFEYDGTHIKIGGYRPANTRRHRNVLAGHAKVAMVVDDLASTRLWIPRYCASTALPR